MANDNIDDQDGLKHYLPAYDRATSAEEKIRLLLESDLSAIKKIIDASNNLETKRAELTLQQAILLQDGVNRMLQTAAYAIATNPDLQTRVNLERQGKNSPYEGMLNQLIELSGSNLDQDIQYGLPPNMEKRLAWQALGMDPDSENEVAEFEERNGISDAREPVNKNNNKLNR